MTVYSGTNAGTYFYAYDGNGNVAALVNSTSGLIAAQYEYGPFGELLRATGPMAKANPFRFSTKYQDDETELLYYGYRSYNPSTGRWLNRDPLEEDGGLNLYAFVLNNPMTLIDPSGEYALAFVGKWTDPEKGAVTSAFTGVQNRLPSVISTVDTEISKVKEYPETCPYKKEWLQQLTKLRVWMARELKDFRGSQNLKLEKKSLPKDIDAQALFDKKESPIWKIQISSAKGNNFFTRPTARQQQSIFH